MKPATGTTGAWRPNPVVDSKGNVHLVWNAYGPGPQSIYYSVFRGGSCKGGPWSARELVSHGASTTYGSAEPCIDLDEKDTPHVAWSQASAKNELGSKCTTNSDCDKQFGTKPYCARGACWPYYAVHLARRVGGKWLASEHSTKGRTGYYGHTAISVVHGRLAFLGWMSGLGLPSIEVSAWNGGRWSSPMATGLGLQFFEVVADRNHLHVLSNSQASYRRLRISTGTWDKAVSLGRLNEMDSPDLVLDRGGTLHAVWNGGQRNSWLGIKIRAPA